MGEDNEKHLINELKTENKRLHKQVAQLEVKLITSQHRIEALESEMKTVRVSPEDAKDKLLKLLGVESIQTTK